VFAGAVFDVVRAKFRAPDGEQFDRDVVRSGGAVGVIPVIDGRDGRRHTVLVRQYRPPFDRAILEIPAGMRDVDGEDDSETAQRELIEEVGLEAAEVKLLCSFLPQPGMTDSVIAVYVATGCAAVERRLHGPEERHMDVVRLPLDEAAEMVIRGEITDAKSVIALLLLASPTRP
ncbi:MAG: NUDIX hydrolase, partial [Actinomycetota bacterium]|nr:NUDIX hydrolase [Actinomycetota bacterium]